MAYDPFARGAHLVREETLEIVDIARDRRLPLVVWRPDGVTNAPLVLYSHASYGHPRQSSFLCDHLASHGYVVAAPEHTGNTAHDLRPADAPPLSSREREKHIERMIDDRVPDLRVVLQRMLAGAGRVAVDPGRIGVMGWSFGGWAALAMLEVDDRPAAVVALAPGGSSRPLPNIIPATLTFRRHRTVPALFLAAERDRFIPEDQVAELVERAPAPKRMFTLLGADHGHFADDVPPDMCSAEHAHLFTNALALAHLDATLRNSWDAAAFLGDAVAALRARGIAAR